MKNKTRIWKADHYPLNIMFTTMIWVVGDAVSSSRAHQQTEEGKCG